MKKRTFKRVASAVAALAMVASLAMPMTTTILTASADYPVNSTPNNTPTKHTIVLNKESGAGNHNYEVYRLFSGKVEAIDDSNPVGGITPGSGFGWQDETDPENKKPYTQYLADIEWAKDNTGKDASNILALLKGTEGAKFSFDDIALPEYNKGVYTLGADTDEHTLAEIFAQASNAASVAKILELYNTNGEFSRAFADFLALDAVKQYLPKITVQQEDIDDTTTKLTMQVDDGSDPCTHDGYYIIIETAFTGDTIDEQSTKTVHLLGVFDADQGSSINVKSSYPVLKKKVRDYNDSKSTENDKTINGSGWTDTADYDIGDAVDFRLTATVPTTFVDYKTYTMTFHDNLNPTTATRFNLDTTSIKVWIDLNGDGIQTEDEKNLFIDTAPTGDTADTDYTVTVNNNKGENLGVGNNFDCDFEVTIKDLLTCSQYTAIIGALKNSQNVQIVVDYQAELADSAAIGAAGNWNYAYLDYPRNPNLTGSGTPDDEKSRTPEDYVGVFTFQLDIDKQDGNGNALEGAEFTLYKWDAAKNDWVAVGDPQGLEDSTDATDTWVSEAESGLNQYYTKTQFHFVGIDDGYYKLVETKVPDGYNAIEPEYFEVAATHSTDEEVEAKTDENVTSLKLKTLEAYKLKAGKDAQGTGTGAAATPPTFERDKNGQGAEAPDMTWGDIDLSTNLAYVHNVIINRTGASLPGTGGIGTTLFYLIGGTLVVGAGVVLITKKRVEKE